MKLYKNLVNAVAETLKEIFVQKRYADKCIEHIFKKNSQWGSRDRKFVAEAVYDIVRNYRLYSELAQSKNNFWFMTAVWLVIKGIELPDWPELVHVDPEYILMHKEKLMTEPAIAQSYPQWLWDLGEKELGKEIWEREATAMNEQAKVVLRMNTLKTNGDAFVKALSEEKIELEKLEGSHDAYELVKRENVFRNKYFNEGWFEVQDTGSQMISEFADPKSGQTVVDACAGAGGKSLHLAALMKNKGKVISMDLEEWKLEECKKRARRAGAFNIETRLIKEGTIETLKEKADVVLLDVPCSGIGVIKRNPDSKWKLSEEVINRTKELQQKIISDYSRMVRPGGKLIYSTCSILPSENTAQVNTFLSKHKDFGLQNEKSIFPSMGSDGFYMALLIRSAQ
jgi:16S rRNA (cytosine967-C5)-methyltransferase